MVKKFRNKLGMSQHEFADKLGVTQGAISHYETGRRPIDKDFADQLIALGKAFDIELTYNDIFEAPKNAARA